MKRALSLFKLISILILAAPNSLVVSSSVAENTQGTHTDRYALIVCGSADGSFRNNTAYMYHVLSEHYCFDGLSIVWIY
jgi:hypothetical protein